MLPAFIPAAALQHSVFTPSRLATAPAARAPSPARAVPPRRAPCMVQRSRVATTSPGSELASFASFFSHMPGTWNSQRTYHYLTAGASQSREESQTTFDVRRLSGTEVRAVLGANGASAGGSEAAQGFRVSFLTRMGSQEQLVRAGTNLAFVAEKVGDGCVRGAYYRDVGYEESGPVKARFVFDEGIRQLQMTTWYTKVVAVDEIRLVSEGLRLRRIVNYRRPEREEVALEEAMLVGFGVEVKGEEERLVE